MAKSFKNIPRPGELSPPAKPASERDFFDLTDEVLPPKSPLNAVKRARNTGNTGNIGNTSNTGNTAAKQPVAAALAALSPVAPADVRQTFVLGQQYLEQLRDYVHARRSQGDYSYSQKQALQEALDLLFAGTAPAPPRPAQARQQEQQRQHRIRQGRRAPGPE